MINKHLEYDIKLWKLYELKIKISKTNIREANFKYQIHTGRDSYYFYENEADRDKDFEKLKNIKQCQQKE